MNNDIGSCFPKVSTTSSISSCVISGGENGIFLISLKAIPLYTNILLWEESENCSEREIEDSHTPHSHPMFISSQPPIAALLRNSGVANVSQVTLCLNLAVSAQYPKTPRFLHIYAAFELFSLIPVYSLLV